MISLPSGVIFSVNDDLGLISFTANLNAVLTSLSVSVTYYIPKATMKSTQFKLTTVSLKGFSYKIPSPTYYLGVPISANTLSSPATGYNAFTSKPDLPAGLGFALLEYTTATRQATSVSDYSNVACYRCFCRYRH